MLCSWKHFQPNDLMTLISQHHCAFVHKVQGCWVRDVTWFSRKDSNRVLRVLARLHILVYRAVILIHGPELVEPGDLFPRVPWRGRLRLRCSHLKEALDVPLGKLLGVLGGVAVEKVAFLLRVRLPELELEVAHWGVAPGHTGEQQRGEHDRGYHQPAHDLEGSGWQRLINIQPRQTLSEVVNLRHCLKEQCADICNFWMYVFIGNQFWYHVQIHFHGT